MNIVKWVLPVLCCALSMTLSYMDAQNRNKGYSPGFKSAVTTSAESPAFMMLVSNSFPILGSVASLPLVTVCGVVSLFSTAIVSPTFTVSGSGSKAGFPALKHPEVW